MPPTWTVFHGYVVYVIDIETLHLVLADMEGHPDDPDRQAHFCSANFVFHSRPNSSRHDGRLHRAGRRRGNVSGQQEMDV